MFGILCFADGCCPLAVGHGGAPGCSASVGLGIALIVLVGDRGKLSTARLREEL